MTEEETILNQFDQYFQKADKKQIQEDIDFINSLSKNGVSFEEYLKTLDSIAAIPLAETGICDDIAYSDLFNTLISLVGMGNFSDFQTVEPVQIESFNSQYFAFEDTYAMAA